MPCRSLSPGPRSRNDARSHTALDGVSCEQLHRYRKRSGCQLLRRPQLLRLPRQLLPEAAALRAVRTARLVRRLLPQADAVYRAASLLRSERLLSKAVLPLSPALLAGMVQLRIAGLHVSHQIVSRLLSRTVSDQRL